MDIGWKSSPINSSGRVTAMAKESMCVLGEVGELAALLEREIQNSGFSCELVDRVDRVFADTVLCVMVFEKYYWRASNRASLTVALTQQGQMVCVDVIGSGGGQGVLFRLSWGAEESFVGLVERILRRQGRC